MKHVRNAIQKVAFIVQEQEAIVGHQLWLMFRVMVSKLTDANNGINFDDGNGTVLRTGWTSSGSDDGVVSFG